MQASVVIPVWNGASVISDCLDAVYAYSNTVLLEIICVDNASSDESAELIAEDYPQVRLLRQPVNLGFAGGVNAGVEAAHGDVIVLLNQDCMVHSGWLSELVRTFVAYPEFGIAGSTIVESDGTVNHAGAMIRRPEVYGVHLTEPEDEEVRAVEYVTGAVFAFRRRTWDIVGRFDEGYYPAYYEECDYCYRARRKGIETAYVPRSRVTHLFSSREWRADPVKHKANQHRSRYRFVSKHLDSNETREFTDVECRAIDEIRYFDQAIGRVLAARDTLRGLSDIIERRRADLGEPISSAHRRQLQVGFTRILRRAFKAAERIGPYQPVESLDDSNDLQEPRSQRRGNSPHVSRGDADETRERKGIGGQLQALQQREYDLLARIHFRSPSDESPESSLKRLVRLFVLRPLSFLIGRDYLLMSELNAVHVARMDAMSRFYRERNKRVDQRLTLLETLVDYDYR